MPRPPLLPALLTTILASVPLAQDDFERAEKTYFPSLLVEARDLVGGEFHGDGIRDAVAITDGLVSVLTPHYGSWDNNGLGRPLALTFDVDVIQAIDAAGQRDSILAANSDGLVAFRYEPSETSGWSSTVVAGPWTSADRVHVDNTFSGTQALVFVLDQDKGKIHTSTHGRDDGSLDQILFTASTGLADAEDFVVLDWDGNGLLDFAVSHGGGVSVYSMTGAPLGTISNIVPHAMASIGALSGQTKDRLAMLTPFPLIPSQEWLLVLSTDGSQSPVNLGAWTGGGWANSELSVGDFQLDGDLDLAVRGPIGAKVVVNSGAPQAFGSTIIDLPDTATSPAVLLAEMEGELPGLGYDLDVLMVQGNSGGVPAMVLRRGSSVSASSQAGDLLGGLTFSTYVETQASASGLPGPVNLRQAPVDDYVAIGFQWNAPEDVPPSVQLQVVAWRQDDIQDPTVHSSPHGYGVENLPVANGTSTLIDWSLYFDWAVNSSTDERVYWLEVRMSNGSVSLPVGLAAVASNGAANVLAAHEVWITNPAPEGPVYEFNLEDKKGVTGAVGPVRRWDPATVWEGSAPRPPLPSGGNN